MSHFFSRLLRLRSAADEMKPGDQYYRSVGDRLWETATIVDLRPDLVGIPHVHFSVAFGRSNADALDGGPRTLALSRFVGEYQKHVA